MGVLSKQVFLRRRPQGLPKAADFSLERVALPDVAPGQLLIRQILMSVDPAMRPMLTEGYRLNEPLAAQALGQIVKSRNKAFPEGAVVRNRLGFRDYALSDGTDLQICATVPGLPLGAYLSVLGTTGFTAYGGMLRIAAARPQERVFVSTAGGAVGSIAIQIARNLGCDVFGSTGSEEKERWIRDELEINKVVNYRRRPVVDALAEAMPNGLDVYFDNVGGDHLDAALAAMRPLGRIAVCGMISGYNRQGNVAPVNNLASIIYRRVMIRGFVISDFPDLQDRFEADMTEWLRQGRIKWRATETLGLEEAPKALVGLFKGENIGKAIVRIGPDPD